MNTPKEKVDTLLWPVLAVAAILIILFFGLRPKGLRFENPVRLIPEKGAIAFERNGMAFVDNLNEDSNPNRFDELTIEMAVQASGIVGRRFKSLLMMHDGDDRRQLIVGQWGKAIIVMNGDDYDHSKRLPRLTEKDAFSTEKVRSIVITSNHEGTRVYIDGALADTDDNWKLTVPSMGRRLRLVLGNSVTGNSSWTGEIYSLAIYGKALTADAVKEHYRNWVEGNEPMDEDKKDIILYYAFKESIENQVSDLSSGSHPLLIPHRPFVIEKRFLAVKWSKLRMNRSLLSDVTLNIIGFIPLGVAMSGFLRKTGLYHGRQNLWVSFIICMIVSLGIEMAQAWIPTRSSSLMDVIMNTIGGWVGIHLLKKGTTLGWNPSEK